MTLKTFEEANDRVREVTKKTKLVYSDFFSKQSGNKVYFKPGNSQQTGAYKVRDAYYRISTMDGSAREEGLITASMGNHAQGVAFAVKLAGVKATVCIPTVTPLMKINRTGALDAGIVLSNDVFNDALKRAYEIAVETGATSVYPFDDLTVATDRDSVAMEIVKELPMVGCILVPVGGGGSANGISTLAKLLNPNIHVIGVEPENAACVKASLATGKVTTLPSTSTITDGTAVKRPDEKIFPYIQKNLDGIITVQGNGLIVSFLDMVENHKMTIENSDLLTIAVLKHLDVENKKIVSILSGGNMDVITTASLIQHGLIRGDHIFAVLVLLPDKPDQLARVAEVTAEESGSVIKLEHNQFVSINHNAAVKLHVTMEAFGTEHKEKICERLKKGGCRPKLVRSRGAYGE